MSTLQHDELLTQSEILEKETLPPAKEADQHGEEEPDEAKTWSGFITKRWRDGSSYVIDFTVGWSFGEQQAGIGMRFHRLRWRDLSVSLRGGGQPMPKPLLQFEQAHRLPGIEQLRGGGDRTR